MLLYAVFVSCGQKGLQKYGLFGYLTFLNLEPWPSPSSAKWEAFGVKSALGRQGLRKLGGGGEFAEHDNMGVLHNPPPPFSLAKFLGKSRVFT